MAVYQATSPTLRYVSHCKALLAQRQFSSLRTYQAWRAEEGVSSYTQDDVPYNGTKWLIHALLRVLPFTEEVYDTMCRIFRDEHGDTTTISPSDWGALFGVNHLCLMALPFAPLSTAQWLVERGIVINWNTPHATYPVLYSALFTADAIPYTSFLLAHGATPNIECGPFLTEPKPLLLYYISMSLSGPLSLEQRDTLLHHVNYLLENGADPLLEDRRGKTVIDLVRDAHLYSDVPPTFQEELLSLLERWA